jgi:hypothetical protein
LAVRFEERHGEVVDPDFDLKCVEAVADLVEVMQVVDFDSDL